MADANKYKSVSLRHETYNKLKDLQHHNPYISISIASVITYLVNKEHKQQYDKVCPYGGPIAKACISKNPLQSKLLHIYKVPTLFLYNCMFLAVLRELLTVNPQRNFY